VTDILAATPYGRADGSSRVRVFEWLDRLGLSAEVLVAMPDGRPTTLVGWAAMGRRAVDAARHGTAVRDRTFWLHREVSPLSPGVIEASLMRKAGVALFDLDDALYADPVRSARSWMLRRRAKAELCARHADTVIAGNERIADWASSLGASSVVVPSCVDPAAYARKSDHEIGATARLVWVGSSSTLSHLRLVLPALAEVRTRRDLEVVVVGPPGGLRPSAAGESPWPAWVRLVPWSEDIVHRELARMDLGLMPLPDLPYERGKCAYKLLQYGAAGLPVVGSPVGVNASILTAMGAAAPVTQAEWVDAVDGVLRAPASERRRLGDRAADVVSADFSFARWKPQMRALLRTGASG
jgi:glycosyltransferase involved in cell wall biosynthesis